MDASTLARFRRRLIAWYDGAARDLPWRRTTDAYRVWISEIMLQQTTVAAVVPYFDRFLARFPDVASLAAASEEDVLRLWEGLGYYSRARNIHRAAKVIVAEHGGTFPSDVASLQALPGVGRYTAGAIASFAYDGRAPIVEANTLRLYARLLDYRDDPRAADGQKALWEFAERVLPAKSPGRFNQALMELGATVCAPASPRCPDCPVSSCCAAFARNAQHEIPVRPKRPDATDVTHAAVAIERDGRWLLRQCPPGERWAGLWDFPRVDVAGAVPAAKDGPRSRLSAAVRRHLETEATRLTGVPIIAGEVFDEFRHTVTRWRIRLLCVRARPNEATNGPPATSEEQPPQAPIVRWATAAEIEELPLSMPGRRIARKLHTVG